MADRLASAAAAGIMHWSWAPGPGTAPSSRSPVAPPRERAPDDVMPSVRKLVRGLAGMVLPAAGPTASSAGTPSSPRSSAARTGTWLDIGAFHPRVASTRTPCASGRW